MAGKINKQEVEYLAKLARVGLTDAEVEKYQKEKCIIPQNQKLDFWAHDTRIYIRNRKFEKHPSSLF